jgi:MYXO-CTERM domain-containing protein
MRARLALLNTSAVDREAAGANCANGGVRIDSGGGGCSAAGTGASRPAGPFALLLLGALFLRRRRRRRR